MYYNNKLLGCELMEKLGLNEIRERYLSFFERKGHLRLPSFPLVPQNDNSLLLINAGMAPLKPYFTGKEKPPSKRITTCQKCIRTPDIELVGKTSRHGTYFEMLGNFSFGDYFKHEAIKWAWEFVTCEMKIPVDRLWISVYEEDDETAQIWVQEAGVDANRIVRLGKEDNFWEIGTGPCGPCSEIYYDRGEEFGCGSPDCAVGCSCDRFVEFWNLVFTQFDKDEQGNYHKLENPNIDAGMGMERLATIMQGVNSLFEVDTISNIMKHVSRISGVKYGENEQSDISLRVVTDHIRGTVFMISDGIIPSNEGRGYVLRRLIRRAARHGKLLGIEGTFLKDIAETVIAENEGIYPELAEKKEYIKSWILTEEESFEKTIDQGLVILNKFVDDIKKKGDKLLSGDKAFKLYDTYGFPIDLTLEILQENHLGADVDGFEGLMLEQKERARAARSDNEDAGWDEGIYSLLGNEPTEFVGYDNYECDARVIAIIKNDNLAESAFKGEQAVVILDKTVFYGESGGQVGDSGMLTGGCKATVTDAKKLLNGKILHIVTMENGYLECGDKITATIDVQKRRSITRNHSATHLLHRALRNVLGNHVSQSGSYVNEDYLRFDFTHFAALSEQELLKIEDEVNEIILQSLNVEISYSSLDEAKKQGIAALFGEKYGSVVRVVKMGDYSAELCGGCHVSNTSQIGLFKILREGAVASGVRRIEAVTGMSILRNIRIQQQQIKEVATIFKTTPADIVHRAESFLAELKTAGREIETLKGKLASSSVESLIDKAKSIGNTTIITGRLDELDIEGMRALGDRLRDKVSNSVIVLSSAKGGKVSFVAMATKAAIADGANAGNIVRDIAKLTGGGGGGKPDSAQAGGKDTGKIDDAPAGGTLAIYVNNSDVANATYISPKVASYTNASQLMPSDLVYLNAGINTVKIAATSGTARLWRMFVQQIKPELNFSNAEYETLDKIVSGEIIANVEMNGLFAGEPLTFAYAIYEIVGSGAKLVSIDYLSVEEAEQNQAYTKTLTVPSEGKYEAKLFVWSNTRPVSKALHIK
jgi:alanyl-tRNA synthetase